MKRICSCIFALLLTVTMACNDDQPTTEPETPTASPDAVVVTIVSTEAPTAAPTEVPTPEPTATPEPTPTPEPPTEAAQARVDEAGVIGKIFACGETVKVTDRKDGYVVIETEEGSLLAEAWLVRMSDETAPEPYTGFAYNGTAVYANGYLEGGVVATLGLNTKVTVEDAFGTVLRLTLSDGTTGYVRASGISKKQISYGGGGGNSGGQDGGDINLGSNFGEGLSAVHLGVTMREAAGFTPGSATILADGVEGYIRLFGRDDEVRVLVRGEEFCSVLTDGRIGTMRTDLLRFSDETAYEAWDGYARNKAALHTHWRLLDDADELRTNTVLHVIDEFADRYLVELDGVLGYISMDDVSRTKLSSGGSSGGSDWTDPVL